MKKKNILFLNFIRFSQFFLTIKINPNSDFELLKQKIKSKNRKSGFLIPKLSIFVQAIIVLGFYYLKVKKQILQKTQKNTMGKCINKIIKYCNIYIHTYIYYTSIHLYTYT